MEYVRVVEADAIAKAVPFAEDLAVDLAGGGHVSGYRRTGSEVHAHGADMDSQGGSMGESSGSQNQGMICCISIRAKHQFSEGLSTLSITMNSRGPSIGVSFKPSCSCIAVKIDGARGSPEGVSW